MHSLLIIRRALAITCAALPLAVGAQQTVQKDWPTRPIRVIVPYVAGGPMDFIGHTLSQKISASLGQSFIIDNRAGAGGAIGTDIVAKAPPDGYTMLDTSSSHASLPVVMKSLPYDPIKDFEPITLVANSVGFIVAANPQVPANNLKEFIALAKASPGKYTFGSGGVGNVMQFAAEFFNSSAGTKLTHVPYKGVGQAITDLLGGRIDVCFGPATQLKAFVQSGKLKPYAITAKQRWAELPNVPTVDEAGVKGFSYVPWYGLWFPAGTPVEYTNRMRAEVAKAFADPEVKKAFADQGFVVTTTSTAEFTKIINDEIANNRRLAAQIGLQPE
jgi:tripartite-type tricarboxylate transporter receptor subunit TctC